MSVDADDMFRVRPGSDRLSFQVEHLTVSKRDRYGHPLRLRRCCAVDVAVTDDDRREAESPAAAEVRTLGRAYAEIEGRHG